MARLLKWTLWVLFVLGLVAALAVAGLHRWAGSGDFRARLEREASDALGVPVKLGGVHVTLWPQPALAFEQVSIATEPAVTAGRAELRPTWHALLRGRREIQTLTLQQAALPQEGLSVLLGLLQKRELKVPAGHALQPDMASKSVDWLPRRVLLREAVWTNARGNASGLDADVRLSDSGEMERLEMQLVSGAWKGARLQAEPAQQAEGEGKAGGRRWAVQAELGGGTVQGHVALRAEGAQAPRRQRLEGAFETRGVELSALAAPAGAGSGPLSGRVDASTTLSAQFERVSALPEALRTDSRFTVHGAVLRGVDLARAVGTVGLSRGGETRFDSLGGELATEGRAFRLRQLDARSGVLRASGEVAVSRTRALSGQVTVDLTAGVAKPLLGVPLTLGGTLDAPVVTLSRGAMLGAALGTAVVPGAGTAAGARLGDRLEQGVKELFGR